MLASLWLAVAGLPVFLQPFPQAADQTAAVAVANGSVEMRRPCLRLRCPDQEWQPPSAATTIAYREHPAPSAAQMLPGAKPVGVQKLSAPYSAQLWSSNYVNDVGVGTAVGLNPVRTPDTNVQVQFGPALRIQPYVDDGTARRGPVARGQIGLSQKLGERTQLTQQVSVEKGVANTYVRNSLGVDVFLYPQWKLDSNIQTTHDSMLRGKSATDTQGNVNLRYSF